MRRSSCILAALCLAACSRGPAPPAQPYDTGGPLPPEQAAYDVLHYELALAVDPARRWIEGEVTVRARALDDLDRLVLDLDPRFEVTGARGDAGQELAFEWRATRVAVELGAAVAAGSELAVTVGYRGTPRPAPLPPWEGGFTWAETAAGEPWVGVSCQVDGADIWWPCKDHPSDEPDRGVDLRFTVPRPLVCISNGRLLEVSDAGPDRWTHHWRVTGPINNYDVTLNLGPFRAVERPYTSVAGEPMTVTWWALPEGAARAERLADEFVEFLRFLEEELGPYPFRADKCAVVETPYIAMEHQTAIAYGAALAPQLGGRDADFSWILLHELAHEWWGNLVSASDWRDFWLHEGFDGYMEARYVERRHGREAYHDYMASAFGPTIRNRAAVAPHEPRSLRQVFVTLSRDPLQWDVDAYAKGAWVLHTLRYLVGDEVFFDALRRWAYPDAAAAATTDGRQCRFGSTERFRALVEELWGQDLGWFFEVYLRQPALPRLVTRVRDGSLHLRWEAPCERPFAMPVEVDAEGRRVRVELPHGEAEIPWDDDVVPAVDPDSWILRAR